MTKGIFWVAFIIGASFNVSGQLPKHEELFLMLKKQDSIFFERSFNQCDSAYLFQSIHPDLAFFHDKSGIQDRNDFLENVQKYICSTPEYKPIRKVDESSLEVYPLYNNGELYGVVQSGIHDFYIRTPGKADVLTSRAKFTHVWLLEKGRWLLREVLSFDHKDPPKSARLKIEPLTGDFYIYTTYNTYEDQQVPANGMYLVTRDGVVMFDTPWDTTQFQPLLDSIQVRHHKKVVMCFATHWHSDKTAGLEYYRQQGIKTYTTVLTDSLSKINNKKRAECLMAGDTAFQVGQYRFETYYPGEGHTADNIVVWFNKEKILYGGCLIKGADDESLGYLGDANIQEYASTLRKVQQKCRNPRHIIIAHSDWRNTNSLKHSIEMADALTLKQGR